MKSLILSIAVGCLTLLAAEEAQAQHRHGPGTHGHGHGHNHGRHGHGHGHSHSIPILPGGVYGGLGSYSSGYYGSGYYGGSYGSGYYGGSTRYTPHYDYVPGHYDVGRGYVPPHVDLHIGNRRYEVLPGGYVSPYQHYRD